MRMENIKTEIYDATNFTHKQFRYLESNRSLHERALIYSNSAKKKRNFNRAVPKGSTRNLIAEKKTFSACKQSYKLWLCIKAIFHCARNPRKSFNNDWWVRINNSHKFFFRFSSIFSVGCSNILFILESLHCEETQEHNLKAIFSMCCPIRAFRSKLETNAKIKPQFLLRRSWFMIQLRIHFQSFFLLHRWTDLEKIFTSSQQQFRRNWYRNGMQNLIA